MRGIQCNNFINIIVVIIAVLNPFTGSNTTHRMTDKDIAGRNLPVKIWITTYRIKSNLTRIFSSSTCIIKNSPYLLGFLNKGSSISTTAPFSIT